MKTLFAKYNSERLPKYQIATKICMDDSGKNIAIKEPLCEEANEHIDAIYRNYGLLKSKHDLNLVQPLRLNNGIAFDMAEGVSLESILLDAVNNNDHKNFNKYFNLFLSLVDGMVTKRNVIFEPSEAFKAVFGGCQIEEPVDVVELANIDLIFGNIFVDGSDQLTLIDYEWIFDFQVPKEFIVWRSLFVFSVYNSKKILSFVDDFLIDNQLYSSMDKCFSLFVHGKDKKHFLTESVKKNVVLFEEENKNALTAKNDYLVQLFIDCGNGFNEESALKLPVLQSGDTQDFFFALSDQQGLKALRLDPLNESCVIVIECLQLVNKDGSEIDLMPFVQSNDRTHHGNAYFFDTDDSNIWFSNFDFYQFEENIKGVRVSVRYVHIGQSAIAVTLEQLAKDFQHKSESLLQTQGELAQTQANLHLILNSRSWKITSPLRKLVAPLRQSKNSRLVQTLKKIVYKPIALLVKTNHSFTNYGFAYTFNRVVSYLAGNKAATHHVSNTKQTKYSDITPVENGCIFVTHDLSKTGAPILLYQLVKTYKVNRGNNFIILVLNNHGSMLADFQVLGACISLDAEETENLIENLAEKGFTSAIANTVLSGSISKALTVSGIETIYLIHEMPDLIVNHGYSAFAQNIVQSNSQVVFGANFVAQAFIKSFHLNQERMHIIQQGVQNELIFNENKVLARQQLSQCLGFKIHSHTKVVLGAGYAHDRKGTDLFAQVAQHCLTDYPEKEWLFVWMGDKDAHFQAWSATVLPQLPISKCVKFIAFQDHPSFVFAAANVFLLSSREDPFPGVALASLANAVPVAMFEGTGGIDEVLNPQNGRTVPAFDCALMAKAVSELSCQPAPDKSHVYSYDQYLSSLLALFNKHTFSASRAPVSVVVPNYNYARYLPQRLHSILQQTHQPSEIIFLDDCSTDDSVALAKQILADSNVPYQIITNKHNQGVYRQWLKGLQLAKHDLVWIAEADDFADPTLLSSLVRLFSQNENLGIAYAQSKIVDQQGSIINNDVRFHTDAINTDKWKRHYVNQGKSEIEQALFYRNTIPNVSAALINKTYLIGINEALLSYRYCGDWFMYAYLLQRSNIAFIAHSLNYFRKHSHNVTTINSHTMPYIEEVLAIKRYMLSHVNLTRPAYEKMRAIFDSDFIHPNLQANEILPTITASLDALCAQVCQHLVVVSFNGTFGGSEVLWYELSQQLAQRKLKVSVLVKQGLLSARQQQTLQTADIDLMIVETISTQLLDQLAPSYVLFSIGDHNDGGEFFDYCQQESISYVIVNQLVKEDMWITEPSALAQIFRGYQCAKATFFTCRNNIEIFESKMGQVLHNAHIHFNPISIDRNDKVDYPLIQDAYHLAFPARLLTIHKGQDVLLRVLSAQKWRERNLQVNFYGEGPDEAALMALTRKLGLNQVMFHGYVDDVRSIWKQNHGFILTSHMEGIPIVLLGAMFAGRVSVVTKVGGNAEVIEDNVTGFIANNPSETAVDEALERAWHNRHNWGQMGQLARNAVLAYYPEQPLVDFENKLKEVFEW